MLARPVCRTLTSVSTGNLWDYDGDDDRASGSSTGRQVWPLESSDLEKSAQVPQPSK
jgi:hypothetical protein